MQRSEITLTIQIQRELNRKKDNLTLLNDLIDCIKVKYKVHFSEMDNAIVRELLVKEEIINRLLN